MSILEQIKQINEEVKRQEQALADAEANSLEAMENAKEIQKTLEVFKQ